MHDTPSKSFFAKERRDLSHGCVRLQNPMGMALFALQGQGEWDEAKIKEKISTGIEQHQILKERMPVLLLYLTANVDENGKAVFLQDIYNLDGKLIAALHKARYQIFTNRQTLPITNTAGIQMHEIGAGVITHAATF